MNICNAIPGEPLPLGRRWEHNATRIVFDISAWVDAFGAGTVRLLHQRQGDDAPYPVAITRTDADGTPDSATGTLVLWDVTRTDTAKVCHYGRAELRYYSGTEGAEEFLAKSEIYRTVVADALGGATADAPPEQREWLDELLEASQRLENLDLEELSAQASATMEAAQTAQDAAQTAQDALAGIGNISASAYPFYNTHSITLQNNESFLTVVRASYGADAGRRVEIRSQISLSVTTATSGSDSDGWSLAETTIFARLFSGGNELPGENVHFQWELGDGEHILSAQFHFTTTRNSPAQAVEIQLRAVDGTALIRSFKAMMTVSGVTAP